MELQHPSVRWLFKVPMRQRWSGGCVGRGNLRTVVRGARCRERKRMEKKEPRGGGRWMGTGSAWPQVMAGLDRDQVEEIYIQKKKKEKKRNVITSLPGLPFCGPPKCFVHPQNQPRLPAAVAGPRAGQLRGAGRAQLIKNGNERRGPRAAVALQRCKLQEGFIGSFSFSGESPSARGHRPRRTGSPCLPRCSLPAAGRGFCLSSA